MLTNGNMWDALLGKTVVNVETKEMINSNDEKIIPVTLFTFEDGSTFCFLADVNDRDSYYAYLSAEGSFEDALAARTDAQDPEYDWRWA